jgi:hypothetical protein
MPKRVLCSLLLLCVLLGPYASAQFWGSAGALTWKGAWSASTAYAKNQVVSYQGSSWVALAASTNSAPAAGNSNWVAIVPVMVGDSGTGGTAGLVPAPAANDAAAGKLLNAAGSWVSPLPAGTNLSPPSLTGWEWANQLTASVVETAAGIYLSMPGSTAANGYEMRVKSLPAPPYSIVVGLCFNVNVSAVGNPAVGVGWRQSSNGYLILGRFRPQDTTFRLGKMTSPSATPTEYFSSAPMFAYTMSNPFFFRLADDNTNRTLSISQDGLHFTTIHSVGRTDFLTADQFVLGIVNNNTLGETGVSLVHVTGL